MILRQQLVYHRFEMRRVVLIAVILLAWGRTSCADFQGKFAGFGQPFSLRKLAVIAHRGASAYVPEYAAIQFKPYFLPSIQPFTIPTSRAHARHSSAAYTLAISLGADYIEPDVMISRDGVAVVMHSFDISETTDVASRSEFAARKWSFRFDGLEFTGWFTFNFTASELCSLRLRQRYMFRSSIYNDMFPVLTLNDAIKIAQTTPRPDGGFVGVYIESKVPQIFHSFGLPIERIIVDALSARGLHAVPHDNLTVPVVLQSFDPASLARFRGLTTWPLVQLLLQPSAQPSVGALLMSTPLSRFAGKVDAVAPDLRGLFATGSSDALAWVRQAHDLKLAVHVWTFRPEPQFSFSALVPASARASDAIAAQLLLLQDAEVDAVFIENPQDATHTWINPSETAQQAVDPIAATAWLLILALAVAIFSFRKFRRNSRGFTPLAHSHI